jgi:hypothetical protein
VGEISLSRRVPQRDRKHGAAHQSELVEAIREDEAHLGRPHTPREREAFSRAFIGQSRLLAAWKIERR